MPQQQETQGSTQSGLLQEVLKIAGILGLMIVISLIGIVHSIVWHATSKMFELHPSLLFNGPSIGFAITMFWLFGVFIGVALAVKTKWYYFDLTFGKKLANVHILAAGYLFGLTMMFVGQMLFGVLALISDHI